MEIEYHKYLASIIECEEKQDKNIKHEWLMDSAGDAVRVANYLRNHGYKTIYKEYTILGHIKMYYIGVKFETLKSK